MKVDNPLDKKLEIWGNRTPHAVRNEIVFVTDTMELCLASAQSLFGNKATPEIAIAIYDRLLSRIASEKDCEQDE